jgi:hypothetical protein
MGRVRKLRNDDRIVPNDESGNVQTRNVGSFSGQIRANPFYR